MVDIKKASLVLKSAYLENHAKSLSILEELRSSIACLA
jgi:hypothetical protein